MIPIPVQLGSLQVQTTKQVLNQEMRQGLFILQMSASELNQYIQEQIMDNPILEEIPAVHEENYAVTYESRIEDFARNGDAISNWADDGGENLEQHLLSQLNCIVGLSSKLRRMARYIIGNLNENGYLKVSLEELTSLLNQPMGEVRKAWALVRTFEPAGVAAADLRDCLLLQLASLNPRRPLAEKVVEHALEPLALAQYERIAELFGATVAEVKEAGATIRELNPRPGTEYSKGIMPYLTPDVWVRRVDSRYEVTLDETSIPRLAFSERYLGLLNQSRTTDAERRYIKSRVHSAQWLQRCLQERGGTLLRVMRLLVEWQTDFLGGGPGYLKPLTLKDIAERVGLHESTVSRTLSGKYASTPRGIVELKSFLCSSSFATAGAAASSESVKYRIKSLIESENSREPYSDQQLSKLLLEAGIGIARRTVAKYREQLGIASAQRRADKQMG
ncbi:RNA polymerase factor sigma-54 [Cohnella suwonensis]|uniref:RNA polymerase factor sigma-54 n=1 Tax=Cohnella suwonensis TaxID=696072 RepID=A0ABW0LR41_9BACL